jgi:hypothetical protein
MKIYTTRSQGERAGERIEAEVIRVDGGYTVGMFNFSDAPKNGEGWKMMPCKYGTLHGLLLSAHHRRFYVDSASCGIK